MTVGGRRDEDATALDLGRYGSRGCRIVRGLPELPATRAGYLEGAVSDMISRVAAAIHFCAEDADASTLALAAIRAMREPTEEMLDAYWHQTGESKEMRSRTHAYMRRYFAAMIDAALGDA